MQTQTNHATIRLMHRHFPRPISIKLVIPLIAVATVSVQHPLTPVHPERAPGHPVTNESVEAGLRQVREALRALPEFQSDDATTHLRLATRLSQQGDPNGAIEEYRAVIRLAPEFAEAYRNLGAVLIDKHEWNQAIDALQTGARLNPLDSQTYYWLGRALLARQNYVDAARAFTRSSNLTPENAETWSDLALAHMAQGQSKKAETALRQAILAQPDFAEAHHRLETVNTHRFDSRQLIQAANELLAILFRRE